MLPREGKSVYLIAPAFKGSSSNPCARMGIFETNTRFSTFGTMLTKRVSGITVAGSRVVRKAAHSFNLRCHFSTGYSMFETIFAPYAAHRHRSAPLLREREEFLTYLQRRGTGSGCLRVYASRLNQIVRFLKLKRPRCVRPSEIKNAARRWAHYRGKHRHLAAGPWSEPTFIWLAKRWFRFHGSLIVPCRRFAFTDELKKYVHYMESKRKLSPSTVQGRLCQTASFLRWVSKHRRKRRLSTISLSDVDRYLRAMASKWGLVSLSSCAAVLRAFFVYAESRRCCRAGIACQIKGPAMRSGSFEPDGPKWRDVLRLVDSTAENTRVGIRAKAILMLVAFYGLRRGEVIRLQLSDFDWRERLFTVRRSKRGGLQQFPLRSDVSAAILRYINTSRPRSVCGHLFISFHPPFGPIHPVSINEIVRSRLERLQINTKHRGPHALRHACATELLRKGASLRDIADFLGHRNCRSVRIYAKFDIQTLRQVSDLDLVAAL
jgi:integrase/recombinase XerD